MFLEKPRCLAGETVEQLGDSYSPLSQFSHAIRIRGQKARGCADSGKTTMSVSIRRRGDQTKGQSDEEAIRRRGDQKERRSDEGGNRQNHDVWLELANGSLPVRPGERVHRR